MYTSIQANFGFSGCKQFDSSYMQDHTSIWGTDIGQSMSDYPQFNSKTAGKKFPGLLQ